MSQQITADHITQLEELTEWLKSPPGGRATVQYHCLGFDAIGTELLYLPGVAVQRAFFPAGMEFPEHIHPEPVVEYVIVVTGTMRGRTGDEVELYGPGECQVSPAGVPHQHWAETDVEVVAVTVPADEGYPH